MNAAQYLDAFQDRSSALLAAARINVDAPLPSCPGWKVADVLDHVGVVWGWSAAIVKSGARADQPTTSDGLVGEKLIDWAEEQRQHAVDALSAADPNENCWTFGLPRSKLFWFRRQCLEATVHAWDVQRGVGEPEPIAADLASDGIDEFFSLVLPRVLKQQPSAWNGESLHFHRTDGDGEWVVRLGPGEELAVERQHSKADVALRGPAESLYLWSINRAPSSDLDVVGDRAVADRWTAGIAF